MNTRGVYRDHRFCPSSEDSLIVKLEYLLTEKPHLHIQDFF